MTRRWFGTDGIRGKAGQGPLARPFLVRLGQALGEQTPGPVFIARDTRASGPAITAALAAGLSRAGVPIVDLGVLPTPGLPMAMRARNAPLGVVVSASHNPWDDNGVKLFGLGGHKLSDAEERRLEQRIEALGGESAEGDAASDEAADVRVEDGANDYIAQMLRRFGHVDLAGMRLVVDCANGAASVTAPRVLGELGAVVTTLFDAPDGRNINADCGSTHLGALSAATAGSDAELGLAFDGDADRVLMVDATGRTCTGDHMLGFLGAWLVEQGRLPGQTVVATVMSNLGLERLLAAHGIRLLRTSVGDRYVHAAMRAGGFALGGEASGHLLFGEEHDYTGDGLYTGLRLLEGLRSTGRDLAAVIDEVAQVPQILLNVETPSRPPLAQLPGLTARVAEHEQAHAGDLRIVLRYSGTENLARVMVEGLDGEVVHSVADELVSLWLSEISIHGPQGAST